MRAHIVRSRGQVAVHSRTPALAARMPRAVLLVINLRNGAAAAAGQDVTDLTDVSNVYGGLLHDRLVVASGWVFCFRPDGSPPSI